MSKTVKALKQVIRDSGKSQYRLAKDSGVNVSAISRLNSNERAVSIDTAERLLDALNHEIIIQPKRAKTKGGK